MSEPTVAPTTNAELEAWAKAVTNALADPFTDPGNRPAERRVANASEPTHNEQVANNLLALLPGLMGMGTRDLIDLFADPRRNIDHECGYPRSPTAFLYRFLFRRDPIFNRVIKCFPHECWKRGVDVYEDEDPDTETAFEKAWKALAKKKKLAHRMKQADVLSGIGRFGLILLGVDDGLPLDQPIARLDERGETVKTATPLELTYMKVFDETVVQILSSESDESNPRYGLPTMYSAVFTDTGAPGAVGVGSAPSGTVPSTTKRIHWTRVIHVTDNRMTSDILGLPRGEPALNAILDSRKTRGASGEGYWRGAIPGFSLELVPGVDPTAIDKTEVRNQIDRFQNSAQRLLMLGGLSAKTMAPVVVDPTAHLAAHAEAIAVYMGIPKRILFGSERGELSSAQDSDEWVERVQERQEGDLTPWLVEPLVDRLIAIGALPEVEEYHVSWPDPVDLSDAEKAAVALQVTQAIAAYVASDCEQAMPLREWLTFVQKFDPKIVDQIMDAREEQQAEDDKLEADVAAADAEEAAAAAAAGVPPKPGAVAPAKPAPAPAKVAAP